MWSEAVSMRELKARKLFDAITSEVACIIKVCIKGDGCVGAKERVFLRHV